MGLVQRRRLGRRWSGGQALVLLVEMRQVEAIELPPDASRSGVDSDVALVVRRVADADQSTGLVKQSAAAAAVNRCAGDFDVRGVDVLVVFVDARDAGVASGRVVTVVAGLAMPTG